MRDSHRIRELLDLADHCAEGSAQVEQLVRHTASKRLQQFGKADFGNGKLQGWVRKRAATKANGAPKNLYHLAGAVSGLNMRSGGSQTARLRCSQCDEG